MKNKMKIVIIIRYQQKQKIESVYLIKYMVYNCLIETKENRKVCIYFLFKKK